MQRSKFKTINLLKQIEDNQFNGVTFEISMTLAYARYLSIRSSSDNHGAIETAKKWETEAIEMMGSRIDDQLTQSII